MDTATQILVIINSSVLIIFLLVGIYALVVGIKLMNKLRRLADKAESVAEAVESFGDAMKMAKNPFAFTRMLQRVVDNVRKANDKDKKRR
jgi:biopolymer transport protein ExbB/TolQ